MGYVGMGRDWMACNLGWHAVWDDMRSGWLMLLLVWP